MIRLHCACGRAVFFDNRECGYCGRLLAFDPELLVMRATARDEQAVLFCANRESAIRCNWTAPAAGATCLSCSTSRIIPVLSKPKNRDRWRKLEQAKRWLIYELLRLGLPVDPARLRFVFKEDRRTNPDVHDEHVSIGHADGVITVNAAEADDVYREQMRVQLNEPYRTLLGHLRHESGHYFFNVVVDAGLRPRARELFGDESAGYDSALARYYNDGPPPGWEAQYISGYASAHPAEDWAECWAHYLHIRAVLESAQATGLKEKIDIASWRTEFVGFIVAINEVLRAMGLPDAYPFVLTAPIVEKVEFIHEAVARFSA